MTIRHYLLDTNICSYVIRQKPRQVLAHMQACVQRGDSIGISAVTYLELRHGEIGRKAPTSLKTHIDAFITHLDDVYPVSRAIIDDTIRVRQTLASRGTPIGPNDSLIAAHARVLGCCLVTNNVREFERVPDLTFENWADLENGA